MARVTIEDCMAQVGNQFEVTMIAAKRARQLVRGANAHVDWEEDKSTVLALREIAEGFVTGDILTEVDLPPMPSSQESPPAPPAEEVEEEDADLKPAKAASKSKSARDEEDPDA